ncbi:MAG: SlyX family protein [Verrucomicrobia bacterium]|nr:SlyX family protein [Verrucomicrobiota bacterium]
MTLESLNARLEQTEASLAHLERNYDELNSVIIDQSRTITRLQKQLEILGETLRGQDVDRTQPHNQKPPHYAP